MRLLLDTHVLLALIEKRTGGFAAGVQRWLAESTGEFYVSTASLWEIAIKERLGKLRLTPDLKTLPGLIADLGIDLVPINEHHALASAEPEPATRDPFDRMLLAQCQIENLRLLTVDRALVAHRLAATAI